MFLSSTPDKQTTDYINPASQVYILARAPNRNLGLAAQLDRQRSPGLNASVNRLLRILVPTEASVRCRIRSVLYGDVAAGRTHYPFPLLSLRRLQRFQR